MDGWAAIVCITSIVCVTVIVCEYIGRNATVHLDNIDMDDTP